MAITFRAQCSVWNDSVAPRDACVINPCFHDAGFVLNDAQGLADDMMGVLTSMAPAGTQKAVKLYDVTKPPPNPPIAVKLDTVGGAPASVAPRELAICLSFYSEDNVKRKRGRLYVPLHWVSATTPSLGNRPSSTHRSSVAFLADGLKNLGGIDVDWVVWSEKDQAHRPVTDWYVDDEWDVVRSRGMRPTTRTKGTTSEGGALLSIPLQAPAPVLEEE